MSRQLRSGREYDAEKAPEPTKRSTRKGKGKETINSEQTMTIKTNKLTFGSVDPTEHVSETPPVVVHGAWKRCGVTLNNDATLKVSPILYMRMYGRPPPIKGARRMIAAPESDACDDTDAPTERDASNTTTQAAYSALELGDEPSSEAADSAPAATDAPSVMTPISSTLRAAGEVLSDDEVDLFITARTSRVRSDSPREDENIQISHEQYKVESVMAQTMSQIYYDFI
ncbi:hypothetical protein BDV93DRAFT_514462 [Ceratobasidium sp. AG-I]|nr:hypothetical protein BDV93DRAFT_514462 [Ceratobasidium sp. AG-I]